MDFIGKTRIALRTEQHDRDGFMPLWCRRLRMGVTTADKPEALGFYTTSQLELFLFTPRNRYSGAGKQPATEAIRSPLVHPSPARYLHLLLR